jgi:hypothetical protein
VDGVALTEKSGRRKGAKVPIKTEPDTVTVGLDQSRLC